MSPDASARATPYWLTGPALAVFLGLVIIPLGMTVLLAFYDWGQYKGIVAEFTLKNFREIFSDSYFLEVFLRTLRIAVLVTLFAIVIGWGGLSLIFAFTALVLLLVATGFAAWGGRFGASKR